MRNGAVTLSGYVFLSVLDIYAFGGFRNIRGLLGRGSVIGICLLMWGNGGNKRE